MEFKHTPVCTLRKRCGTSVAISFDRPTLKYLCLMSFLLLRGSVLVSRLYQNSPYSVALYTYGGMTSLVLSSHALFTGMYIVDLSGGLATSGLA